MAETACYKHQLTEQSVYQADWLIPVVCGDKFNVRRLMQKMKCTLTEGQGCIDRQRENLIKL